jgi:hypothetical protein
MQYHFASLKFALTAQSLSTLSYYKLIYLSKDEGFNKYTFGISTNSTSILPI